MAWFTCTRTITAMLEYGLMKPRLRLRHRAIAQPRCGAQPRMNVSRQIVAEKMLVGRVVPAPLEPQSQQQNVEPVHQQRNLIMDELGQQRPGHDSQQEHKNNKTR